MGWATRMRSSLDYKTSTYLFPTLAMPAIWCADTPVHASNLVMDWCGLLAGAYLVRLTPMDFAPADSMRYEKNVDPYRSIVQILGVLFDFSDGLWPITLG